MLINVKTHKIYKIIIIPLLVVIGLISTFLVYVDNYYHADQYALDNMESSTYVSISKQDYGYYFDGPNSDDVLIFYPGAKVEEIAYAPMLHLLAKKGMDVCLVTMPFRFAIFGINSASGITSEYDNTYKHYYIGGHSLGGAMAASYASSHSDIIDGLILFASYSTSKIDENMKVISIYGSNDEVLQIEKYKDYYSNLPSSTIEHVIQGGNHAQFGSYGHQDGDGEATISKEEQIKETVSVIITNTKTMNIKKY